MPEYKGSQIISVRIPDDLLRWIDATIERINPKRFEEPFTRGSFIKAALEEKKKKMRRSAAGKRKVRS